MVQLYQFPSPVSWSSQASLSVKWNQLLFSSSTRSVFHFPFRHALATIANGDLEFGCTIYFWYRYNYIGSTATTAHSEDEITHKIAYTWSLVEKMNQIYTGKSWPTQFTGARLSTEEEAISHTFAFLSVPKEASLVSRFLQRRKFFRALLRREKTQSCYRSPFAPRRHVCVYRVKSDADEIPKAGKPKQKPVHEKEENKFLNKVVSRTAQSHIATTPVKAPVCPSLSIFLSNYVSVEEWRGSTIVFNYHCIWKTILLAF